MKQIKEIKVFNFKLTEEEANLALQCVARQPYDIVANLVAKIKAQGDEQFKNNSFETVSQEVEVPDATPQKEVVQKKSTKKK